jgi:hypothetical protein
MEASHNRKDMTARVIRPGDPPRDDADWENTTPEERINAVWELTLLCLRGRGIKTVNRDFRDLLAEFNVQGVEYLIVGAHALAAHGHVRATIEANED